MKKILAIFIFFIASSSFGQISDLEKDLIIERTIEFISQEFEDSDIDFTGIIEIYYFLIDNPRLFNTYLYLLKKTFLDKKSKDFLIFFLLSAISPDIDIIWSFNNVELHRVLSHSLLLSPIFALFISSIFYIFIRKNKNFDFKKVYLISLS